MARSLELLSAFHFSFLMEEQEETTNVARLSSFLNITPYSYVLLS